MNTLALIIFVGISIFSAIQGDYAVTTAFGLVSLVLVTKRNG